MQFTAIKTRKFLPPQDNIYSLFDQYLPPLKNKDILVITSKIVSIHQGRSVLVDKTLPPLQQKIKLIQQEADAYFKDNPHSLAIKNQTLTPYAGIDRSNANEHYVLWPKNPHQQAKKFWQYLRKHHHLKDLAVIIVDSFCLPLRWGHMGISIGFYGFHPNKSYTGKQDIFNHKIIAGNSNLVDAISAISTTFIGEGNEQTPMLLIRNYQQLKFTSKDTHHELEIPKDKSDLYSPLLKVFDN